MVNLKEKNLIAALRNPSQRESAFGELVSSYQQMLYYHVRRMVIDHEDADDVLQNTFLKAWRYLDNFRGDASIKTWLYRIATNESLTFLSKRKKHQHQDINDFQDDMGFSSGPGRAVDGDEIQKRLQVAIAQLPDRQRAVFNMRYFDQMKYDEISSILEVSVGGLKANYHHAVKKIEKFIKEGVA
jgi:RNA polymerase sigma-70 factor (ECF subfamily)